MTTHRLARLTSDQDWVNLFKAINPSQSSEAVKAILKQLRESDAVSVITEPNYLDQDFTAVYAAFYSKVFRRHTKLCSRLHFFSVDVAAFVNDASPSQSAEALETAGNQSYLGFIVVRPVAHAPLGRVVLKAPKNPPAMCSELLVYATYEVHVLGATLRVNGVAMTQQDARVGACAQASMWMASRHFFMKNHGPWFSTVEITAAATQVYDSNISKSLPAGSEFLSPDNMARGLRAMEREPLIYFADYVPGTNPPEFAWLTKKPADIINRYIDSGIPVILGLSPLPNDTLGHAVLATGRTVKELPAGTQLPQEATCAEFCEAFLVNDDQRGTNLRLPLLATGQKDETPFSIAENLRYLIVPLPRKILIPAEQAEVISWSQVKQYATEWPALKASNGFYLNDSVGTGDMFVDELSNGRVVARTYLTHGWKYKARMLRNLVGNDFKSVLYYHELPKFVWVTEFGTLSSLNHIDADDRRIFAHSVIDATARALGE